METVAGNLTCGSASKTLCHPTGIFVYSSLFVTLVEWTSSSSAVRVDNQWLDFLLTATDCSMCDEHYIDSISLPGPSNPTNTIAGKGAPGSASNQLSSPYGIFVNIYMLIST
jgi:hypothetical protein